MRKSLKRLTSKTIPKALKRFVINEFFYSAASYHGFHLCSSQEGEDMVLANLFSSGEQGFYVDVGAHHPTRFSNTFYFYKKGWSGINVDPNEDLMTAFKVSRPRDINLCLAIDMDQGEKNYYQYREPALNSIDSNTVTQREAQNLMAKKVVSVQTRTLSSILDEFLPKEARITFMTIDTEGNDIRVLQSNNWDRYRPRYVLAEDVHITDLLSLSTSEVVRLMTSLGYSVFAKTRRTLFFVDERSLES